MHKIQSQLTNSPVGEVDSIGCDIIGVVAVLSHTSEIVTRL